MEHLKIYVFFICDFNCCHANPIIKEFLLLFGGKIARNGQYRFDIGLQCEISLQIRNYHLEFVL